MDKLHLSVIAVVLYLNLPGSKSQQILLATHHNSDHGWNGRFLLNCSTIPEGASQTAIAADFSYKNIKTFLCTHGRNEECMLKHLNLSNNLITELSLTTCRNLAVLETLNLNDNAIHTLTLDLPMPADGSNKYGTADRLLPALKLLSVERNNLNTVPRGLGLLQSLQSVHMTSNGIRQIDMNDFQSCSQLKEIILRKNKITKIHPDAFRDLNKLQVVDLRENALTTPLPQILISLNFFQLEVDLSNNAWIFDCQLNSFKHLFNFGFDSPREKMSISYNKSASNSQKPLLYLSSFHLNCSDSVLLKRAVIPTGKTSVLSCDLDNTRGTGVSWWTPKGRISKDNSLPHMTLDKRNNLVIHDAEKAAAGLYLCIFDTAKKKYLIYNVRVKEEVSTFLVRKARDTSAVSRQGRTDKDLILAVCLSVLITFICAFCLGAFARPYLVSLWRLLRGKKNSVSEHTYCNQAFSDETLSREFSASNPTKTPCNLCSCDENSSRNTCIFPTETSTLHENVTSSSVHASKDEEGYQKPSNNEINLQKNPVFSNIQPSLSNDENINDEGLFSVRIDYKNSNEVTPGKLSNDVTLWKDSTHTNNEGSKKSRFSPVPKGLNADSYTNNTDSSDPGLPFTGETGFPFSTIQTHTAAQDSRTSEESNSSGLLQSDITEATPDSPERRGIISHNEHVSTTRCMPERQSCDEQLGLNGNVNISSDVEDLTLPSCCKRYTNIENLSVYRTTENSPLTEHNCKMERTTEKDASADMFGDSSSDGGTPFTMSDCSSLADFDLEQPNVSDNLPVCQSSLEEADTNNGKLPETPNVPVELQHVGKTEDKNNTYFETTINYGSGTITPETAPPYTGKGSDHVSLSDSDTISSSSQEVADIFYHFTNAESRAQNSTDSLPRPSTDSGNALFSLQHFPTDEGDTEEAPEEAVLQLCQFPLEPQHSLSCSPTEQEENAHEGSRDEHTDLNSSAKNNGEGDMTLGRNRSTSEEDDFIFAPIDSGLNEIKKTSLLHSSDESALQSQVSVQAEKHFTVITDKDDLLPQGQQVNTTDTCEDKMQRGVNEKSCDGYPALGDASNSRLPEGTQPRDLTAALPHLRSSGRTPSGFKTEDHFQLSDKGAYSFSVPQGFFNTTTQGSSCSFPQQPTGNLTSETTDAGKMEDDTTLTGLENNSTTDVNLQNTSDRLSPKSQSSLEQGQLFVKKKRAFDGFANILQSRKTNFNS